MARDAELRAKITAQDDASKVIDSVAKKAEKLDGEKVEVKVGADTDTAVRDIDGLLQKIDKLGAGDAANLLLTTNASAITNEIGDLVTKLDTLDANDPMVDVTVANIAQLSGDLDQISAKAKEINDTPIRLDTTQATTGIDQIGKSADSSKSVLANMVGNATQDLGALSGVAGSAGVAIGQMGEYMVDAANSGDKMGSVLKNFGAVAAPIAAIVVAVSALGSVFEAAAEKTKRAAEYVKLFTKAAGDVDEVTSSIGEMTDQLSKFNADARTPLGGFVEGISQAAAAIPVLGGAIGDAGQNITDVLGTFNQLGITAKDVGVAVTESGAAWDNLAVDLDAAREAGLITSAQHSAAIQLLKEMRDAQTASGEATQFATGMTQEQGAAYEQIGSAIGTYVEQVGEAAERQAELDDAVSDGAIAMLDAAANSEAFATALDRLNQSSSLDFGQMAQDTVKSFDDVKGALDGIEGAADIDWSNFDITPDEYSELRGMPEQLGAVTDAVSGMRDSIQTELKAAFDTGGIEEYSKKADFFAKEILDQFPAKFQAMGASTEEAAAQTQALVEDLGLLPEQVQIVIELTREEEARNALEAFQGFIDKLDEPVQVAINTKIAEGDIEGAKALLDSELIKANYPPIVLPIDAEIAAAVAKADAAQAYADSLVGTEAVDADIAAAQAAADEAKAYADSLTGTETVDADAEAARAEADAARDYADAQVAMMDVDGNDSPFRSAVGSAVDWANRQTATVNVTANVKTITTAVSGAIAGAVGGRNVAPSSATPTATAAPTGLAATTMTLPAATVGASMPINVNVPAPVVNVAAPSLPPIVVRLDGRPVAALIGSTTAPAVRAAAMTIRAGRA